MLQASSMTLPYLFIAGLTFGAQAYLQGKRWGRVMLFDWQKYPQGAIAPVSFLWRNEGMKICEKSSERTLWIWVHPAGFTDVWTLFKKIHSYPDRERSSDNMNISMLKENETELESLPSVIDGVEMNPNETLQSSELDAKKVTNVIDYGSKLCCRNEVTIRNMKDEFVKFRLRGPASNLILLEALKPASVEGKANKVEDLQDSNKNINLEMVNGQGDNEFIQMADTKMNEKQAKPNVRKESKVENTEGVKISDDTETLGVKWWQTFYNCQDNLEHHDDQKKAFKKICGLRSPAEIPAHAVLALTVRDPRLHRPTIRTKVDHTMSGNMNLSCLFLYKFLGI